ncbi:hypothetical protein SAMN05660477_00448 [Soonwooa buanensis]|uniref:Uncharacterized protein n=1 Tax=Soonwooa buanensis TaxID=619805 RepID=A0A1T5CY82_9FLAO|nr:hypothetical protein SAMN05660477_00448 [Soonwooa buanensis]
MAVATKKGETFNFSLNPPFCQYRVIKSIKSYVAFCTKIPIYQ